jgi:hypothetical protein
VETQEDPLDRRYHRTGLTLVVCISGIGAEGDGRAVLNMTHVIYNGNVQPIATCQRRLPLRHWSAEID